MIMGVRCGKTIVDRSPGVPICVPFLRAMGWSRPRLRSMTLKLRNKNSTQSRIYSVRRNRRVGRLAALFACLALLASSLCAQTPQKSRFVTVDHGAKDPAISPDGARIALRVLGKTLALLRARGDAQQVSSGI